MLLTVTLLLALSAFVVTIMSTFSPPKASLWVAVLLLTLIELLRTIPVR